MPSSSCETAIVYHVFSHYARSLCNCDASTVILSIATFRSHDLTTPIYVIDKTPQHHDWMHFPELLNFIVVPDLPSHDLDYMTGKVLDVANLLRHLPDTVIYSDSDVFWLSALDGKSPQKFGVTCEIRRGFVWGNSGYYYFKKGTSGHSLFEMWVDQVANSTAKNDDLICFLNEFNGNENITDESILCYLLNRVDYVDLVETQKDVSLIGRCIGNLETKGIHVMSVFTTNKIKFCFDMMELNSMVRSVLSEADAILCGCPPEYLGSYAIKDIRRWVSQGNVLVM